MRSGEPILKNQPTCKGFATVFLAYVIAAMPMAVFSQDLSGGGASSKLTITPRVSLSETYTNNVFLASSGARSELITQVSPGIRISSQGGRVSGSLDYSFNELLYARGSSGPRSDNALSALATLEAVEKWAYVDFSGAIGRQSVSAFGAPATDRALLNGNSTETSVFSVTPRVAGRLLGIADYQARYSLTTSQSQSASVSDVLTRDFSGGLRGVGGRVGWTLDASHQVVDFSGGRSTTSQRFGGQLTYALDSRWGVYVKASHESNSFASPVEQQGNFTALGVSWTPNEETKVKIDRDNRGSTGVTAGWFPSKRTSISFTREGRLYGDTQSLALAYRTPRTAWTFSDSRSVVSAPGQQSTSTGSASLYDVLYGQFAAGESDPVKREQYDAFLQANGIKPLATAIGGFLTSTVSLQHQQQLSFALFGARTTLAVIATRGQNTAIGSAPSTIDDFAVSPVIRQNGITLNASYRLTDKSSLSLAASRQKTTGSSNQTGSSSRSVNVKLSTQLSRDASASVGARRVVFDASTAPYSETAVLGNLTLQF